MNITNPIQIRVAIIGGGMFFDDIIGQCFKDLMRAASHRH